jgi:Ca-activated chloride channel family protein
MPMSFLWPDLLWLCLLLPVLGLGHRWRMRHARGAPAAAAAFMQRNVISCAPRWQRRVSPALLLLALALLVVAMARPTATLTLPTRERTIILALDVSGSMEAADVAPNRIRASQAAARDFVDRLPPGVRIGIVGYSDSAHLVQPPTRRHDDAIAAIGRLQVQQGTAIGSGILASLGALFPQEVLDASPRASHAHQVSGDDAPLGRPAGRPVPEQAPTPPGSYASAAIVLLTDGQNSAGPDPVEAAQEAASRGVKVYTVGFGTADGKLVEAGGVGIMVRLDEDTLKKIAEVTRGEYFHADSGHDLDRTYQGLQSRLVMEAAETELTSLFAAAATLMLLAAAALSAAWFGKVA